MKSAEFAQRRSKFFEKMAGNSIAIFPSNPIAVLSNDVDYLYRQNSNLYYLSGFPEAETILVFEKTDELQKFTMFVPPRDVERETWNGRRAGVQGVLQIYQADEAFSNEEFAAKIQEKLPNYETVYYQYGIHQELDEVIPKFITAAYKSRNKVGKGPYQMINAEQLLAEMRVVKSEYELDIMIKSSEISKRAHEAAIRGTHSGMYEYELEALFTYEFTRSGARRHAYTPIIGSGVNGTILHYVENTRKIEDGDLILADVGAEFEYYAADITRTWPANGKFSSVQAKVYQAVLDVQKASIELCKPGADFNEISDAAIRKINEYLVEFGLLSGDIDTLIEEKKYKRFYMHGLGHWLGMDTHDVSRIDIKKTPLQPGMIFTVEPGIYISNDDDIPEEYRGIGIRIEDDILITENGHINLTDGLAKEIAEIEQLMQ